jgi:hypothetical protein
MCWNSFLRTLCHYLCIFANIFAQILSSFPKQILLIGILHENISCLHFLNILVSIYTWQCSEPPDFYTILLHLANIFVIHIKFLNFYSILLVSCKLANIFAEILASFWTFLFDFREHYDNIVFISTFSEHFRDPSVLYHTDSVYIFFCNEKIIPFPFKKKGLAHQKLVEALLHTGKHFRELLWVLNNAICCGWTFWFY